MMWYQCVQYVQVIPFYDSIQTKVVLILESQRLKRSRVIIRRGHEKWENTVTKSKKNNKIKITKTLTKKNRIIKDLKEWGR